MRLSEARLFRVLRWNVISDVVDKGAALVVDNVFDIFRLIFVWLTLQIFEVQFFFQRLFIVNG